MIRNTVILAMPTCYMNNFNLISADKGLLKFFKIILFLGIIRMLGQSTIIFHLISATVSMVIALQNLQQQKAPAGVARRPIRNVTLRDMMKMTLKLTQVFTESR